MSTSSAVVTVYSWRWSLWELVWMTGPILVLWLISVPETSTANILRRRAQRLRKVTGRTDLWSQSEIDQANLTVSSVFWDAVIKPVEIMIKDPAVAFTNIYVGECLARNLTTANYPQTALTYGIYYSFFEVFPLVYPTIYGFSLGELGLTFLAIGVACLIGVTILSCYLLMYLVPDIQKHGLRAPEHRLVPALFAVITLPVGYFMFGES
jgi:DHA1 family multidrug resistance protein-like MFS transporter